MIRVLRSVLLLLVVPSLVWGQAQLINGNRVHAGWINYGTTAGTATAYTLSFTPAMPGYVPGQCFLLKAHVSNTGSATLNVQGLGAKTLKKLSGGALVPLSAGDLPLNHLALACYDGTDLQLIGTAADGTSGGPGVTDGDKGDIVVDLTGTRWTIDNSVVSYAKLQSTTAASVLLGRGSAAGAGPPQEITLGSNCSLSGTVLNCTGGTGGVTDGDKGDVVVDLSGTRWLLDATALIQQGSLGLNVPAPATAGLQAATAAANNVTLHTLKRATDTTPTGNFAEYQSAASVTLWRVDIDGILQVGNVPAGRITGGITGSQMADNTVTLAKLADMGTATLLGRTTAGTGDPEVVPLTTLWTLPKKLENTRMKKRVFAQPNVSPITIDANTYDIVKIAELSQATTFNPPTGTPDVGDLLLIEIFTTVQRALTFSTATNGFIGDTNMALPTLSDAGGWVKYLWEWNGTKWSLAASSQTTTRGVLGQVYTSAGPTTEPGWAAPAALTGDVTTAGSVATIAANAVTLAKMADIATGSLLGRTTAGTGDPEVLSAATAKALLSLNNVDNTSDATKWTDPKKLENTRIKKRTLTQGNAATITIDTNSYDVVKIPELLQPTTFAVPSPATPDLEDTLTIELFTSAQRALTFSTATNGFIADHGLALPTVSDAGSWVKYLFAWNGSKWAFVGSTQTTTRGTLGQVYTSAGPNAEPGWAAGGSITTPASTVVGRGSAGGTGAAETITLGTNLTMSGTTLNATGGLTGTTGEIMLPVGAVNLPTTNMAVIDNGENNTRLLFDGVTSECAWWGPFRMKPDYASTPVFKLLYSMTSATTGGVSIDVSVMVVVAGAAVDANTDSYATVNNCDDAAVPTTLGGIKEISCPLTNNDGLVANALTKIKLCRATTDSADTASTSDLEALAAALVYTR
jgi:hypothetical protein